MKYISSLKFESRPDYAYLRSLFSQDSSLESLFRDKARIVAEPASPPQSPPPSPRSKPTYAMLAVLQRMKERQTG